MAGLFRSNDPSAIVYRYPQASPARNIAVKLQEIVSVRDFGAVGNGTTDDYPAIQACIDFAIANNIGTVFIPGGNYRITDTIKLGTGATATSISLRGTSASQDFAVSRIFADFTDRPAISVQGSRKGSITDISIRGRNIMPDTVGALANNGWLSKFDPQDWITVGCTDGQYNPYCGIAFDPYSGTDPGVGANYPNDTYGRATNTSGFYVSRIEIRYFVAAIAIKPSNNDAQAEDISIRDSVLRGCAYGVTLGGSQNKGISISDTKFDTICVGITCLRHGRRIGFIPRIFCLDMVVLFRLFEFSNSQGAASISGVHAENFTEIGLFGIVGNSAGTSIYFNGCNFSRNSYNSGYLFASLCPVVFSGCNFRLNTGRSGVMQAIVQGSTTLDTCTIQYVSTAKRALLINRNSLHLLNCINGTLFNFSAGQNISDTIKVSSIPARLELSPTTNRIVDANTNKAYLLIQMSPEVAFDAISRAVAADKLSISFSVSVAELALIQVGDWFSYLTNLSVVSNGVSLYTATVFRVPTFQISTINTSTRAVTATNLSDGLWTSTTPETTNYLTRPAFVNAVNATGTLTSGSTSITAVTDISNFLVGDWIQGIGLATNSRITAIDTTNNTLTLNIAATASGTAVEVFNSKLIALN